jgi:hypothetical protein
VTSARTADVLVEMDVDEEDNIVVQPTPALQPGESIVLSGVTRTCEVYSGVDSNPSSIFDGLPTVNAGRLLQRIVNPDLGATYLIRFVIPLSSGRVLVGAGLLPTIRLGSQ